MYRDARLTFTELDAEFYDDHESCDDMWPDLTSLGIVELDRLGDDRDPEFMDLPRQHAASIGVAVARIVDANWRDDLDAMEDGRFARPSPSF